MTTWLPGMARPALLIAAAAAQPGQWSGYSFPPFPRARTPLIYCCAATITWRPEPPWRPSTLLPSTRQARSWNRRRRALKQRAEPTPMAHRGDEFPDISGPAATALVAGTVTARASFSSRGSPVISRSARPGTAMKTRGRADDNAAAMKPADPLALLRTRRYVARPASVTWPPTAASRSAGLSFTAAPFYAGRMTQRKPRWLVEVSTACAIRAAGR